MRRLLIHYFRVPMLETTSQIMHCRKASFLHNSTNSSFESAVNKLNSLQSNVAVLQKLSKEFIKSKVNTAECVEMTGISLEELESKLSVIHVTGTKGKGSTCSYCESILRHQGFSTGFYSSPHLISVRERLRINGSPISTDKFAYYFWDVYNKLSEKIESNEDMPGYFNFLTVMAFNVFFYENVDVVILEVGIGGKNDCTNILRNVPVVGITPIGLDHTNVLGNSVEEIAMNKAGIMKPGCVAFTPANQHPNALNVLKSQAAEKNCPLIETPGLKEYNLSGLDSSIGVSDVQYVNASLALQLAKAWVFNSMNRNNLSTNLPPKLDFNINEVEAQGLKNVFWPGRYQRMERNSCIFYLDGAHTSESIELCAKWYLNSVSNLESRASKKIVLFNSTGNRSSTDLLTPLAKCQFDLAIFCPNLIFPDVALQPASFIAVGDTPEKMLLHCQENSNVWAQLTGSSQDKNLILPSITEALEFIEIECKNQFDSKSHVLVTGSLIFIGQVLSVLDPNILS